MPYASTHREAKMTTGDEQQLRPPWERLLPANGKRGESDVALAAFCAYCKLPEGEDNLRRLAPQAELHYLVEEAGR